MKRKISSRSRAVSLLLAFMMVFNMAFTPLGVYASETEQSVGVSEISDEGIDETKIEAESDSEDESESMVETESETETESKSIVETETESDTEGIDADVKSNSLGDDDTKEPVLASPRLKSYGVMPTSLGENWTISINWGDASANLPDDWCPEYSNEETIKIKTQVTVECQNAEGMVYNPGDVVIKLSDVFGVDDYDLNYGGRYSKDISAVKSGEEGTSDWTYVETLNSTTGCYDYVFMNRNTISTSFTSTFQILLTFYGDPTSTSDTHGAARYFEVGFNKDITAVLEVGGETINSNTLKYSWKGTKDVYNLEWEDPKSLEWANPILSKIPNDKWEDYIFLKLSLTAFFDEYSSIAVQNGNHVDINFPSDVVIGTYSSGSNFSDMLSNFYTSKYLVDCDDTRDENQEAKARVYIPVAIPRSYLNVNSGVLELKADWYGTYYGDTDESLLDSDTLNINLNNFDIIYTGELYALDKMIYSSYRENYIESMRYHYENNAVGGIDNQWYLSATAVYYGKTYDAILGDDLQYFIYEDNTYRRVENDEKVITSVRVSKPSGMESCDYELYGKILGGSDEYVLIKSGNLYGTSFNSSETTTFDDNTRYYDIKVRYIGLDVSLVKTQKLVMLNMNFFDNKERDNGKEIDRIYNFAYLQIGVDGELVPMEYSSITNLSGLKEEILGIDASVYNSTVLRESEYSQVYDLSFFCDSIVSSFYTEFKYVIGDDELTKNIEFEASLTNKSKLPLSITGYTDKIVVPSYVSADTGSLLFRHPSNLSTKYTEEEFESTFGVSIGVTETIEGSNRVIAVKYDLTNNPILSEDGDSEPDFIDISIDCSVALDDYYILGLNTGKTRVYHWLSSIKFTDTYTNVPHSTSTNYYSSNFTYPDIARSSFQTLEKEVATSKVDYTKSMVIVDNDKTYSYKLRVSGSNTRTANIVLYDSIEGYDADSWKGEFTGYSLEKLGNTGVATSGFTVYYSLDRSQVQDLSADGWVLSDDWANDLSEVKSIAFDFGDYVLEPNSLVYVEIFMKAPNASTTDGEVTKNQATVSYVEYDSSDTELATPLNTVTNLVSNVTEVRLGYGKQNISGSKSWVGDTEGNRPESITVNLLQDGVVYATKTVTAKDGWKYTFENVPVLNASGLNHEYSIQEVGVTGYETSYSDGENEATEPTIGYYNIINTFITRTISGTKTWVGDTEAGRPESITVNLLQNGVVYATKTVTADDDWKYSFEGVPVYGVGGTKFEYSVSEGNVDGYTAEYSGFSKNGLAVTFNNQFKTESVNYDYVEIYFNLDGSTYKLGKWGGTSLAGKTVEIPSTDFYLYWRTDNSQCDYYGFSIDSIVSADVEVPSGLSTATLPISTVLTVSGENYPESPHNPYVNSTKTLWHYTGDKTKSSEPKTGFFDIINTAITKTIELKKVDYYTGKALEGVNFELYKLVDTGEDASHVHGVPGSSDCWVKVDAEVTDADGKVSITTSALGSGVSSFALVETPLDGYVLPSDMYWLISVNGDSVDWKVVCDAEILKAFDRDYSWMGYSLDASVDANTGVVTIDNILGMRKVEAVKRIKADAINFANGNPTFLFKLVGECVDGETRTYHEAVEFNKDYVDANTDSDGYVSLSTSFDGLVPGNYTLSEEIVSRYELESISNVTNGAITTDGDAVEFNLVDNDFGSAVFTNKLYESQWFSHNSIVINEIGGEVSYEEK